MENILKLGGKEFKVEINFKKSYELTKYRNKVSMGFDVTNADKEVIEEILQATQNQTNPGEFDISKLSPSAVMFLRRNSEKNIFTYEEIIDITKILTGLENEEEIEQLLTAEMQETDYDSVLVKLMDAMNIVFTNAKGTSK